MDAIPVAAVRMGTRHPGPRIHRHAAMACAGRQYEHIACPHRHVAAGLAAEPQWVWPPQTPDTACDVE